MAVSKDCSPSFDYLGFGLGLRTDHYQTIINEKPKVDWFEILKKIILFQAEDRYIT